MREISLESNELVEIDKSSFFNLNNLKLVCLNNNPITTLFPTDLLTFICSQQQQQNNNCTVSLNHKCIRNYTLNKLNNVKLDQFIQFVNLDQKRQDMNITDLEQRIASLENDLESFNKRLLISENKSQISRMQTGILNFGNFIVYNILTKKKTLMFNQSFSKMPQMFFTLRNVHVIGNVAPLWLISNLKINQTQWECDFIFLGSFHSLQLDFQWVALGN